MREGRTARSSFGQIANAFGVPMHAATTTRLLVDLKRSIGHRHLFSEFTRSLSPTRRQEIIDGYHPRHRQAVESEVARNVLAGAKVIHVASDRFTPTLDGVERRADVTWLYNPRRPGESAFVRYWMLDFASRAPGLRRRRNCPYQGRAAAAITEVDPHAAVCAASVVDSRHTRSGPEVAGERGLLGAMRSVVGLALALSL